MRQNWAIVSTERLMEYVVTHSGNIKYEPGAVVCRVSPSFVRFGTFQLPVSRGEHQVGLVKQLADYVIRHHYSHLQGAASPKGNQA